MTRALSKVHKQISKKRGTKVDALHENSRDAKRLRRASAREEKLARNAAATVKARQIYLDRVTYFQQTANDQTEPISDEQMAQLITQYLSRHTAELDELRSERRSRHGHRPPSKREETLSRREDSEKKEFVTGFWVPDMSDQTNWEKLRDWNGEWSALSSVAFVRVSNAGEKKESRFPPGGLS